MVVGFLRQQKEKYFILLLACVSLEKSHGIQKKKKKMGLSFG